jgi:hypothetical protein
MAELGCAMLKLRSKTLQLLFLLLLRAKCIWRITTIDALILRHLHLDAALVQEIESKGLRLAVKAPLTGGVSTCQLQLFEC